MAGKAIKTTAKAITVCERSRSSNTTALAFGMSVGRPRTTGDYGGEGPQTTKSNKSKHVGSPRGLT